MHDADHETPGAPERMPETLPRASVPETVETAPQAVPQAVPQATSQTDPQADPQAAPQAAPQPKSAYELPSKKNTVLRNMVWALALTMAVVVVVGIAFFGVGSDQERERLENSELDVVASAERAQEVAPFPVVVPEVQEGWTERGARYTAGTNPQWTLEYSSPDGQLVTLVQESQLGAPMVSAAVPGGTVQEEFELAGSPCSLLLGGEQGTTERGIACEGEDWGLVVHGDADRAALEQITSAAITSLD